MHFAALAPRILGEGNSGTIFETSDRPSRRHCLAYSHGLFLWPFPYRFPADNQANKTITANRTFSPRNLTFCQIYKP